MPRCSRCNAPYEPGSRYCPECGQRVLPAGKPGGSSLNTEEAMSISDIRFKLGMAYFKKGDYLHAVESWEKVLEGCPDDAQLKALIEEARALQEGAGG